MILRAKLPSHLLDLGKNLRYDVVFLCNVDKRAQIGERKAMYQSVIPSLPKKEERRRTTQDEDRELIQDGYYSQKDGETSSDPDIFAKDAARISNNDFPFAPHALPDQVMPVFIPFLHFSMLLSTMFDRKADVRVFVERNWWLGIWLYAQVKPGSGTTELPFDGWLTRLQVTVCPDYA